MTKEQVKVPVVKEVDFVEAAKKAVQAHGASTFIRLNFEEEVSAEGLKQLNEEYSKEGYEAWSNDKSVLLVRQ